MITLVERYYEQKFALDVGGKPSEDQYVNQHTNGLCVVGIASTHPITTRAIPITKIEFDVDKDLHKKVSGKYKRGAPLVYPNTALCTVHLADNSKYTLRSCVYGSLLEVNENITTNPNLLLTKASTEGFLAIIKPNEQSQHAHFKSFEDYHRERGLPLPEKTHTSSLVYDLDV